MNGLRTTIVLMLLVGLRIAAAAGEEAKPKPEAHTVAKGRLLVVAPLDGVFVAAGMSEVSLRPETWTELTVVEAVEHGRAVKKGDLVVKLDRRKIDDQIRDEEAARKHAMLAIEQLQAELRVLEPSVPADLAFAERAKTNADADLQNFLSIGRDLMQRNAELEVKSMETYVDFAKDELDQLEKMYKADDLTEETEELILKRTRNQLELTRSYLAIAKTNRDLSSQFVLPRQEANLREAVQRQSMALDKTRSTLPLSVTKMKLDLEKQNYDLAKAGGKLEKLKRDAELLTVLAPADGIVYYGACVNGEWTTAAAMPDKLKRGGSLAAHEVFMTVVEPAPLAVRATVPEKELYRLTTATTCRIAPSTNPLERLAGRIDSVDPIPGANGKFSAKLKLEGDGSDAQKLHLAPGMKCSIKAIVYDAANLVTIPTKALQTDEFDDQKFYVNIVDAEGKHSRRDVTVGQRGESAVEITSGLAEGEKILPDKPSEAKKE